MGWGSITEHNRMIRQKTKEARELRTRVLAKYQDALVSGKSQEDAEAWVLECFDSEGLTERRLRNILQRRLDFGNPALMVYTDARAMVWLEKMETDVEECRATIDSKLDEFDDKNDEDWIEVEETSTSGGKYEGETTKKRPVWAMKLELYDEKIKKLERYFNAVKALRGPSQTLLNVQTNVIHTDETAQDLSRRIRDLEKQYKVKNGVADEVTEDCQPCES